MTGLTPGELGGTHKLRGRLFVGTAGFTSASWAGAFYPAGVKKTDEQLHHYQASFGVVEVNSTFYGVPNPETIDAWRRQAAEGFLFVLKVPKAVTHEGGLASEEALAALRVFLERAKGLGPHLGAILFQCSRSQTCDLGKLRSIGTELKRAGMSCRVAFEFRNASWLSDPEVKECMQAVNWALVQHPNSIGRATVGNSSEGRTGDVEHYRLEPLYDTIVTADFVYVRLHGDNDEHSYCFSDRELAVYAEQLHLWRERGLDVFCFLLNDDASAAMPRNAKRIIELTHALAGESVPSGPKPSHQRSLESFFGKAKRKTFANAGASEGPASTVTGTHELGEKRAKVV